MTDTLLCKDCEDLYFILIYISTYLHTYILKQYTVSTVSTVNSYYVYRGDHDIT